MLNNWVIFFDFFIMKFWDLAQENLVNIQDNYGILINIYGCQPHPSHGPLSVKQLKNDSYR